MKTGDIDILVLELETAAGAALTYATKALFLAAGFALTWKDSTNTALATQPDWTLPVAGSGKRHQFDYVVPDGAWTIDITKPSTHIANPSEVSGEGQAYDDALIGARLDAGTGVTITPTLTASTAEMFDGDSINVIGISIPEAALTAIGATSLADCTSRKAFIKIDSQDSNDIPTVPDTDLTVTSTSDSSGNRVVKVTKDVFPPAIGVLDDGGSLSCTLHVRLTKGAKTIIAGEIKLAVRWTADQGDAV